MAIPVSSITLNADRIVMGLGDEPIKLIPVIKPFNADDKTVIWTSGDTSIAVVDSDGMVTPVSSGIVDITATVGAVSAVCRVVVLTESQGLMRKFILDGNIPDHIANDEFIDIIITLLAIVFGNIRDSDELIFNLSDIDDIPDEYLRDLSALIGYEFDDTIETYFQRLYIKKFLALKRIRGTPLSLKMVAASFAQDEEGYFLNPSIDDIQLIEYGVNDQNYAEGESETWKPGCMVLILPEGADIVRKKIFEVLPAGTKLSYYLRQFVGPPPPVNYKVRYYELYISYTGYAPYFPITEKQLELSRVIDFYPYTVNQIDDLLLFNSHLTFELGSAIYKYIENFPKHLNMGSRVIDFYPYTVADLQTMTLPLEFEVIAHYR